MMRHDWRCSSKFVVGLTCLFSSFIDTIDLWIFATSKDVDILMLFIPLPNPQKGAESYHSAVPCSHVRRASHKILGMI